MTRFPTIAALCVVSLSVCTASAFAQSASPTSPASTSKASTTAAKTAAQQQRQNSRARGLALATETVETITASQLEIANRVLVGKADCEFNQQVEVTPVKDKPGHFLVGYKKAHYVMVPQETTTGAVRLEDKKGGFVWLQIPSKSMLMASKQGHRMVDACMHSEQRAAVAAAASASQPSSAH